MQELASVERHLLQAKARALTEEEKTLSERKEALSGYKCVTLPSGTYAILHVHVYMTNILYYNYM